MSVPLASEAAAAAHANPAMPAGAPPAEALPATADGSVPAVSASAVAVQGSQVAAPSRRCDVVIGERVRIPAWVDDLETFRRWARSEEFPKVGRFSYLQGNIWADLSMEQFFSHNQVKAACTLGLMTLLEQTGTGRFVPDRMLLSNPAAGLFHEPDGLFYTWSTMQSGRLRLVAGAEEGFVELEGAPDMVLEIVSRSSHRKDTVELRSIYFQAGVPEYWLVDALGDAPRLDILRHGAQAYEVAPPTDGWIPSAVFQRQFRLVQETDPLGHPRYTLEVRAP